MAKYDFKTAFIDFWDKFVEDWFVTKGTPTIPESKEFLRIPASGAKQALNPLELPEPYLGDAENCKFVIINYNPGDSGNGFSKCYSSLGKAQGTLINEYAKVRRYSTFIKKWSPLNSCLLKSNPPVCGVDWWQGKNGKGGRMRWIQAFAQKFGEDTLKSDHVFALELCPYHSFSKGEFACQPLLRNHYMEKVFKPAAVAASSTKLKFATCVGDDFNRILLCLGCNLDREWTEASNLPDWPVNRKNNPASRQYRLWHLDIDKNWEDVADEEWPEKDGHKCAYFLVLSHSGGNYLPGADFDNIDKSIASEVKKLI